MESCLGAEVRGGGKEEGNKAKRKKEKRGKKNQNGRSKNLTPSHHLMAYTPAQLQPSEGGVPNRGLYSHTKQASCKEQTGASVKSEENEIRHTNIKQE